MPLGLHSRRESRVDLQRALGKESLTALLPPCTPRSPQMMKAMAWVVGSRQLPQTATTFMVEGLLPSVSLILVQQTIGCAEAGLVD